MENSYKELRFEQPKILVNPHGIKIYIGTKDEDNWCVEIPKELCKVNVFNYDKNLIFYLITEKEALAIAKKYTEVSIKLNNAGGFEYDYRND